MDEEHKIALEEAVKKVKTGDKSAFAAVVDMTIGPLRAYAAFFLRDRSKIDDALQEAYVVMYRTIDRYVEGTSFMAWARTITRFEALSQYRQTQRKEEARMRYTDELTTMMSGAAELEDKSFPLETKLQALRNCIEGLPQRTRDLVQRRYFSGVSVDSLARELNSRPSAVSMALHRARTALAGCVGRGQ